MIESVEEPITRLKIPTVVEESSPEKPRSGRDYLRPIIKFFRGEVAARQLDAINDLVGKEGFCAASAKLLEYLNININIVVPEESSKILSTDTAVILYSNHEATLEPVAIFAALKEVIPNPLRKQQIRAIGHDYTTFERENIAQRVYPIVSSSDGRVKSRSPCEFFWGEIVRIAHQKSYPFFTAARKNLAAVKNAAEYLSQGNIIYIAPFSRRQERWGKGIGYLAQKVKTKSPIFAIPILVEGASRKQLIEAIFGIPHKPAEMTVKLGLPLKLKESTRGNSATTLTNTFKEYYNSQFLLPQ